MFDDIYNSTTFKIYEFRDNVRDEFGLSIYREVFEPMLSEIAALVTMNENINKAIFEIDQVSQELNSFGKYKNEQRFE